MSNDSNPNPNPNPTRAQRARADKRAKRATWVAPTSKPTPTHETVASVNATRYAARSVAHVTPTRRSDDDIIRDAALIIRASIADTGKPMGWVETLRTMRWTPNMGGCNNTRFTGRERGNVIGRDLYADALALAQSKRKIA